MSEQSGQRPQWSDDILPGFEQRPFDVDERHPLPEESGARFAGTLVRPRRQARGDVAVVYVPGFNDYFFHAHVADFFAGLGRGFYAVDLRRSGRSWRPGQVRSYVSSIDDYAAELDEACAQARADGYQRVVVYGHSTGGLAAALYADRDDRGVAGLILNSPFLALPGPARVTRLLPAIKRIAARAPERAFPGRDPGLYARSLHISHGGEWDYDLALKPDPADPLRFGWLGAVIDAQGLVARGLSIACPVLCCTSARSTLRATWDESCARSDVVLDQKRVGAAATRLGADVSVVRILDGVHDLALSRPEARARFFAAIERWVPYAGLEGERAR